LTGKLRNYVVVYVLVVATVVIVFFSGSFLLDLLTIRQPIGNADAIVLLAGNMKERLPVATRLFKENYAPLIILANGGIVGEWSAKRNRNFLHIELAEERIVSLGVPREKIVKLPYYGSATMFDALAVMEYLEKKGLKKIIIVTSDYHTRRALWTFKYVLKDFTEEISIASAISFETGVRTLALEYLKLGFYLIKYGLFGFVPQLKENLL